MKVSSYIMGRASKRLCGLSPLLPGASGPEEAFPVERHSHYGSCAGKMFDLLRLTLCVVNTTAVL